MTAAAIRVTVVVAAAVAVCTTLGLAQSQRSTSFVRTAAVSGVVTEQTSGRPLRGVVITLSCTGASRSAGVSLRTVTDSKGRFVFLHLPASDRCNVAAAKSGYVSTGLARQNNFFLTTGFALSDDDWIRDADVVMFLAGSISGIVVDERGEPIVNAPVRLLTRVGIAGTTRWAFGPVARTDDRGIYRITGLPPGKYMVSVPSVQSSVAADTPKTAILPKTPPSAIPPALPSIPMLERGGSWQILGPYITPPSGPIEQAYPVAFYPNARSLAEATPIDLATGEDRRAIDFSLAPVPTTTISGRVVGPAEITGHLVVRLLQEGAEYLGMGSEQATALVAADGSFTLINVPAGRYSVEARTSYSELNAGESVPVQLGTPGLKEDRSLILATGSPYWSILGAVLITRQTGQGDQYFARAPITVGSNAVTSVVLSLARGATISGRVVNEDGSPVSAAISASVEPANGDPAIGGQTSQSSRTADVPAGTFAVHGLLEGDYFLHVGLAKSVVAAGIDYTTRPFTITAGRDITDVVVTRASKPASISGPVRNRDGTDVRTGAVIAFPVDSQQWTNFGLEPMRIKTTGFFGRGYQISNLPAGEYFIIAIDESQRDAWLDPRFFPAAASLATHITLEWGTAAVQALTLQRVVLK